jgi:CBS domain-containing protein
VNWHAKVREVMTIDPVSIDVLARPSEVQEALKGRPFHHLAVLDRGVLVGIVSTTDLARVSLGAWVQDEETEKAWLDSSFRIRDLMTWEPQFVRVDEDIRVAADKLSSGSFHSLPVLDDGDRLVGIITSTDILRMVALA